MKYLIIIVLLTLIGCKTTKTSQSISKQSNLTKADTIAKRDSSSSFVRIDSTVKIPESTHDAFINGLPKLPNGFEVVLRNDSLVTITVTKTDTVYRIKTIIKERLGKVVKIVSTASNVKTDTINRFQHIGSSISTQATSVTKPRWILNWWWLVLAVLLGGYLVYKMRAVL